MIKNLKVYRKNHSVENKSRYLHSRIKYLKVCKTKKLELYEQHLKQLNTVRSSSDWWELSNSMKTRSLSTNNKLNADVFLPHFSNILQSNEETHCISWTMPYVIDAVLDSPIEYSELYTIVKALKQNKAPGQDGISFEFYKHAPVCFLKEILSIFNKMFLYEQIPKSFRKSILIPLFKKGDPKLPANYRGLSLIDTICKIFNSILLNRLTFWIDSNNILNEYQAGFRKNYATVDNIFNLTNIVHINKAAGKKTFAFFVDFSCAFDTIPRNSLFYKLSSMGLSSKIIRILQSTYKETESRIWDGNSYSDTFTVDVGVKQGCILSPILFSLYTNDLADELPGGVNIAGVNVKILLYADDIVILSDTATGLQRMIDKLCKYCLVWCLRVNLDKSKIVIFRTGTRVSSDLNWKYGQNNIEIVNSYKYLGVDITYNLSFKKHLSNKLSTAKLAINSTWSKYINNPRISKDNKLRIFHAASRSIMFYAAQVWGFKKYDEVEKLFRFFIKKMLYLPNTTPNYMLSLETGLDSLYLATLKLHFSYIDKVLSMKQNRLPRILANYIITNKLYWAAEWDNLKQKLQILPDNTNNPTSHNWEILNRLRVREKEEYISAAIGSQFHDLYSRLDFNVTPMLTRDFSSRCTSLVIKARGGLLDINARAFRNNTIGICTICNLDVSENTFHFIGVCPIYNTYRLQYFGKTRLEENEVIRILNGTNFNFNSLCKYLEISLKYRKLLMNEFDM